MDNQKVTSLFGGETMAGEPSQKIIAAARRILERAEKGEIAGFAWAEIAPGGYAGCGFEVDSARWTEMLGIIVALQTRYTHHSCGEWMVPA